MYQTWNQTLVSSSTAGTPVTAQSTTDLIPNCDYTFPTNIFVVPMKFRIKAIGVLTTTSGSNTMTFAVQLGSTVINAAFGAIALVASQTNIKWDLEITCECRTVGGGTSTTFLCQGLFLCAQATTPVNLLPATGAAAVGTGIDFTATQKLQLMGAWNAASNSITVEQYEVTSLN